MAREAEQSNRRRGAAVHGAFEKTKSTGSVTRMGSAFYGPGVEQALEWILLLSVAASGLCFLGLAVVYIVSRYR